jgi:hypothetical protein
MDRNHLVGIGIILGAAAAVGILLLALERVPGLRAVKDSASNRMVPRAFEALLLVLGPALAVAEGVQGEWGYCITGAGMFLVGLGAFLRSGVRRQGYAMAGFAVAVAGTLMQRVLLR